MKQFSTQINHAELAVLMRELRGVLVAGVPGDIVELGCYKGETSVELHKLIRQLAPDKQLWLYDSFEGLPPKSSQDSSPAGEQFKAGELPAHKKEVLRRLAQAGAGEVRVKKAWFSDLTATDLPDQIAFAFLDGDFYQSITDSLRLAWPKLVEGAIVVVDDYASVALPGAAKAVDEWLRTHPAKMNVEQSLAIIRV